MKLHLFAGRGGDKTSDSLIDGLADITIPCERAEWPRPGPHFWTAGEKKEGWERRSCSNPLQCKPEWGSHNRGGALRGGGGVNERSHLHAVKKKNNTRQKAEIPAGDRKADIRRDEGSSATMGEPHLILEECLPGAYSNRT